MNLSESMMTEFKQEYIPDINKVVVAFANTNGGMVYVGVADDGNVVGVDDPDAVLLKVANSIRDSIKPDVTLFVNCETEVIEGKTVIKIIVQKGTASPYYITGKGIRPEGVYVRQGASTVPASETAILKMIKETDGEKYEDVRSLNQDLTFIEAEKEFSLRNVPFGSNQKKSLKLITVDDVYTNLGLLLSDQCIHTVKLAIFEGTEKEIFKDRREFSGSLLKQLNDIFDFIDLCNHTRAEFVGLHRIDKRDYPVEAMRETLLNVLIHRDYSFSSSTLISVFENRMEFLSVGGLMPGISIDDVMLGLSVARNEKLANVFYRLELIEAYGTGLPKIMRSYDNFPMKPQIKTTDNAFKITLPNNNAEGQDSKYNKNEQIILNLLKSQRAITRKDAEGVLSLSQAMTARILKGLVEKGGIRVTGRGKNTRYV